MRGASRNAKRQASNLKAAHSSDTWPQRDSNERTGCSCKQLPFRIKQRFQLPAQRCLINVAGAVFRPRVAQNKIGNTSAEHCLFSLILNMKTIIRLVLAATALVLSVSSLRAGAPESIAYFDAIAKEAAPVVGEQYYLRHCLTYESGKSWRTTNYKVGILVPINSKITLTSLGSKRMQIRIEKTNQVLTIENIEKHTQKDMATIAKDLLTRQEVPVDKFDEKTQKNIRNGMLALGMTKEQTVMTRGFPPAVNTPSLDIDTWIYNDSVFVKHTLIFQDGVLVQGRGLL
jgi:hypothetical protein